MIVSVKNRRSIEMSTIASFGPGAVVKEAFDELAAFATGGAYSKGNGWIPWWSCITPLWTIRAWAPQRTLKFT